MGVQSVYPADLPTAHHVAAFVSNGSTQIQSRVFTDCTAPVGVAGMSCVTRTEHTSARRFGSTYVDLW
jgi:hypothetical protein